MNLLICLCSCNLLFVCLFRLVVKFIDAVRRVELAVRLKKKQTKLKSKEGQLEQLKQQEYNLVNGSMFNIMLYSHKYFPCFSDLFKGIFPSDPTFLSNFILQLYPPTLSSNFILQHFLPINLLSILLTNILLFISSYNRCILRLSKC